MAARKKTGRKATSTRRSKRTTSPKAARSRTKGRKRAARKPARRAAARSRGEAELSLHFRPERGRSLAAARRRLREAGIEPVATTASGAIVARATRRQVEEQTGHGVKERLVTRAVGRGQRRAMRRSFLDLPSEAPPPTDRERLGRFVFPVAPEYWQAPSAFPPGAPYYHLHPSRDLARLFGVELLHRSGVRGGGVRVVMIDSGFFRHPYYTEPLIHGPNLPNITTHGVLAPQSDPEDDSVGHGTGIAANVFALAPDCEFHHIKDDDDPLAAMVMARQLQPQVITCSWGWGEDYVADVFTNFPNSGAAAYLGDLEAEIQAALADGTTVLFASGNGPLPGSWPSPVAGVVSVGGVLVTADLDLEASSYATSFVSITNPGRLCPDVCGLVGPAPHGLLFPLPTQPNNQFDAGFSAMDGTAPGDGWLIASGTSSATPQVAGLVALLLEQSPGLAPAQVLARLRELAVGVQRGQSASGHVATGARPNLATGFGFASLRRPQRGDGYTGVL